MRPWAISKVYLIHSITQMKENHLKWIDQKAKLHLAVLPHQYWDRRKKLYHMKYSTIGIFTIQAMVTYTILNAITRTKKQSGQNYTIIKSMKIQ